MSLATREQKAVVTNFACAGAFRSFGRQKNMKERLEENASERLRLKIASKWVYGNMFTYKTNESNFNEVKTVVEYNDAIGDKKRRMFMESHF